ncbi:Apolipoprotein D [Gryllus bimaculatus]|nr:Apolipoprotein D [Gryllus bimaculatus]
MAGCERATGRAARRSPRPAAASAARLYLLLALLVGGATAAAGGRRREDKTKCPQVKAIHNFDVHELLGRWFVVQYYASSEEALAYRCMRAELSMPAERLEVSMNFTYAFSDDPAAEALCGNITWAVPDAALPSHWVHAEDTYTLVVYHDS